MKTVRSCFIICLLSVGSPAVAQDIVVPPKLSLDEALRIADQRNPVLAGARASIAVAAADRVTAGARPNPAFTFESEGYPLFGRDRPSFINGQEIYVRADQELETAGRRRLRLEGAALTSKTAQASYDDARRQLHLEIRRAYFQLVLARADQSAARTSLDEIDKVIGINRARLEQGEISGGELRRIQVERLRFVDDAFSAELAARNARAALLALMNVPRFDLEIEPTEQLAAPGSTAEAARVGLPGPKTGDAPGPDMATGDGVGRLKTSELGDIVADALARRPDLAAARSEEARAASETRLQRALRTPNVTIGGGYRRDFGENGLLLGVTVPLPIFDKNAGAVARSEAERQLAASRVAAVQSAVALDVQQAANAVEVNRARVAYIEREYLPNSREARDIVQASYSAGAADLLDFLDAQRAYRETQRTYNRALFDYRVSLFQLDAAVAR